MTAGVLILWFGNLLYLCNLGICIERKDDYTEELAPLHIDLDPLVIRALQTRNRIHCGVECTSTPTCVAILFGALDGSDCYNNNNHFTYTGTRNTTWNGITCQRWDVKTPHVHYLSAPENYCRDPDSTGLLWCYTVNPSIRWVHCDIPVCYPDTNCRLIAAPIPAGSTNRPGFTFYKIQPGA